MRFRESLGMSTITLACLMLEQELPREVQKCVDLPPPPKTCTGRFCQGLSNLSSKVARIAMAINLAINIQHMYAAMAEPVYQALGYENYKPLGAHEECDNIVIGGTLAMVSILVLRGASYSVSRAAECCCKKSKTED